MNSKNIGRIVLIFSFIAIFVMAITAGSQAKPQDSVELREIDRLKYENLVLSMSNLQLQMQAIQRDGQRAASDLRTLKDGWFSQYELSPADWAFDEQTMKFQRKKKP